MTYTPTKEELEELGFYVRQNETDHIYEITSSKRISCDFKNLEFRLCDVSGDRNTIFGEQFYPQSLDDIKTLIRLLTPQ